MKWQDIINNLLDYPAHGDRTWTDGEEILCKTEEQCEAIADFLETLGIEDIHTGYYDPEEDKRSNEVDNHTGWYYIDID